uniref:Protein transport protein SEC24 n=1 Tax=Panagrellus redivivus TaxID=6233 RepID=A0A7E4WB79_PANRE
MSNVPHTPRYIDLCTEGNVWNYGLDDNRPLLPPTVNNNTVVSNDSVFRCTVSAIPGSPELAKKCRLPLGITVHPFRDQRNLHILQTNIVRCRYCRAYINPYVHISDSRRWRCNICSQSNDLPDNFSYKKNCDRRPEMQNTTVEYFAGSDYMIRSPQSPCYVFILDVSQQAIDSQYLNIFVKQLLRCLDEIPGGEETRVAFFCIDSGIHCFQFTDTKDKPRHYIVADVDDPFFPVEDGLLVELKNFREPIRELIQSLPDLFQHEPRQSSNCLGAGIRLVYELISDIGGRVSVFQASLPDSGVGALQDRENNNTNAENFGLSTDYYKNIALESTIKQISYDFFVFSKKFIDLATLAELSKITGGSIHYYPDWHSSHSLVEKARFEAQLHRYLTRKLGCEAVLRIRCSTGIKLHSFYGNFFVRSPDLMALPNVSPDATLGALIEVDESFCGRQSVVFQAALLYTTSKGERRIRVHTLALPVCSEFGLLFERFDLLASVAFLVKMASDRVLNGLALAACRESIVNAVADALRSYNRSVGLRKNALYAPFKGQLKFFALYIVGLLKHRVFSISPTAGSSTDNRIAEMLLFRNAPIEVILNEIYPTLYAIHTLSSDYVGLPQRLPLTYASISPNGIYLLDTGSFVFLYICYAAPQHLLESLLGVMQFAHIDETIGFRKLDCAINHCFLKLVKTLQTFRGNYVAPIVTIREDGKRRSLFTQRLIEDKTDDSRRYVDFIHQIQREIHN